jgi:hypothetical protein
MAFGNVAKEAGKRIKKQAEYYVKNKGEMSNMGVSTRGKVNAAMPAMPAVSRVPSPAPTPRGSDLGNDAKNVKIRQRYESMPEGLDRPNAAIAMGDYESASSASSKKKKKSGAF